MALKDNPCKRDCPERTPTCHGDCNRYAKYVEKCAQERMARMRRNKLWPTAAIEGAEKRKFKAKRDGIH